MSVPCQNPLTPATGPVCNSYNVTNVAAPRTVTPSRTIHSLTALRLLRVGNATAPLVHAGEDVAANEILCRNSDVAISVSLTSLTRELRRQLETDLRGKSPAWRQENEMQKQPASLIFGKQSPITQRDFEVRWLQCRASYEGSTTGSREERRTGDAASMCAVSYKWRIVGQACSAFDQRFRDGLVSRHPQHAYDQRQGSDL